jgi:5-hydroxyisourate hydrolase
MARVTTHVLDTSRGIPASGILIELHYIQYGPHATRVLVAKGVTNAEGRTDTPLLEGDTIEVGVYELTYRVADYFTRSDSPLSTSVTDPPFLGDVVVRVGLADPAANYHVPLLLSPHGYTAYRGA